MKIKEFLGDIWQHQRVLMTAGFGFIALLLILGIISLFDSQQILGINRWIKPMKFASSIAIFLWTLAVYLYFLREHEKASRVISLGVIAMMCGEMILIIMQAARGTTSHFNHSTAFNDMIFSVMGLMITVSTILIIYLTALYFRARFEMPKATVWGMRLGLVLFLLASFEGGYMSAQIGHAVGVADGGAGLPLVNWSTEGGDLRAAHFVGMHALQMIPLFSLMLVRLEKRFAPVRPIVFTFVFAMLYFSMFSLVFVQALRGRPLLGKEIIVTQKALENKH